MIGWRAGFMRIWGNYFGHEISKSVRQIFLFLIIVLLPISAHSETLKLDYEGFALWLDCERNGATQFHYTASADSGSFKRHKSFYLDPNVPRYCQQSSTATYKRPKGQTRYDRGHLVPANHLDGSRVAIKQSNYMTNILPQAANMNRGAWLLTEEIIECYRDLEPLDIWGGVIWGNDTSDDFFVSSHGVETPDAFWKVIVRGNQWIAWVVPNSPDAKRANLDRYLVSIDAVEKISGLGFDLPMDQKMKALESSWQIPAGCNKG
jgi:endonuclease G, mitochondrial